jgi:hypothetical protein
LYPIPKAEKEKIKRIDEPVKYGDAAGKWTGTLAQRLHNQPVYWNDEVDRSRGYTPVEPKKDIPYGYGDSAG